MNWQDIVKNALFDLLLIGLFSTAAIVSNALIQQALAPAEEPKNG